MGPCYIGINVKPDKNVWLFHHLLNLITRLIHSDEIKISVPFSYHTIFFLRVDSTKQQSNRAKIEAEYYVIL